MSQSSTSSEVPEEIVCDQDSHFIIELSHVNDLYFANETPAQFVPLSDSEHDEEEIDERHSETEEIADYGNGTELEDFEHRTVDLSEASCVDNFKTNTCGCSKIYGSPCSSKIDFCHLLEYRQQCQEMSSEELDLTVKVQLAAHRKSSTYWPQSMSKKQKIKERERVAQKYYFAGQQVCRDTFLFCHGIGKFKLNNIAASLDKDGLKPRVHGNTGKIPKHALSVLDVKRVSQFLEEYTVQNGLPLPGRQPNYSTHGNKVVLLLPSDKSKADIWELYNQAAVTQGFRYSICDMGFKNICIHDIYNFVYSKLMKSCLIVRCI